MEILLWVLICNSEDILHTRSLWIVSAGIIVSIVGYFLWNFMDTRSAVVGGGFSSAGEMHILHRFGYGSRVEYLADLEEQTKQVIEDQRIQGQLLKEAAIAKEQSIKLEAIFNRRVQELPNDIVLVSQDTEVGGVVALEDFKLACELANGIERQAVLLGARAGLFRTSKVNSLVQEDPLSLATVEISPPVRWNEENGTCRGWFNVDGIYSGSRYRGFYYGVVRSLRKDGQGNIRVASFDEGLHFVNALAVGLH